MVQFGYSFSMTIQNNFTLNPPIQYTQGEWKNIPSKAPEEIGVTLFVNGEEWLTFMCSPFQIEQLAVGFLFNEQFIHKKEEVEIVHLCKQNNNVDVWLSHAVIKPNNWKRGSDCNGSLTLAHTNPIEEMRYEQTNQPETILAAVTRLFESQIQYQQTRGIHCSLLTDGHNTHIIVEDIGRHNTIDKIAGYLLLSNHHFKQKILATTGRISSEMLAKAANIGAEIVISRTSPTQNSIQSAHENGITLIGYARRNQFTIYTHPQRLIS
jgi:FdhD protein